MVPNLQAEDTIHHREIAVPDNPETRFQPTLTKTALDPQEHRRDLPPVDQDHNGSNKPTGRQLHSINTRRGQGQQMPSSLLNSMPHRHHNLILRQPHKRPFNRRTLLLR
mmetsp:Transcript_18955/g.31414  ORF Transcript_18955/g.31414 Transcript_18955/m.31414 type:complete len:109 (+) Transcript_18955:999-1325(+)